jgi:hypothetical protein
VTGRPCFLKKCCKTPQNEAGEDVDPLSRWRLLGAGAGAAVGLGATTASTRGYSTTLGELRAARATYRGHQDEQPDD